MRADVAPERANRPASRLKLVYHGSNRSIAAPRARSLKRSRSCLAKSRWQIGDTKRPVIRRTSGRCSIWPVSLASPIGSRSSAPVRQREDLMRLCATGDVGLALLPADSADFNEREMVGASNKPFDYLANGLPVLVADLAEWRATFVDAGLGRVCDPTSAESVANALRWFLDHPVERDRMGQSGKTTIAASWNYETTFAPGPSTHPLERGSTSAGVARREKVSQA